jgi:hypothetical protein
LLSAVTSSMDSSWNGDRRQKRSRACMFVDSCVGLLMTHASTTGT